MTFSEFTYDTVLWLGLPVVGILWAGGMFAAIHMVPWRRFG